MSKNQVRAMVVTTFLVAPMATQGQQPVATPAVAAAPALVPTIAPAAPTPTLWRYLGIPQTAKALRSGLVNRRGNLPGLERKPPLIPIAAPENLLSPNPAIKAAAEIKQAEDMKMQKIKAIKYLASLGCGCYDKDGKITDALLAGTDDCTPDVRLAVIEAIEENVNQDCCKRCGTTSCCNEKTSKRLSEIAYERDDSGCHLEPSAEIRKAAARVLKKCCPGGPPSGPIEEDYEAVAPVEEDQSVEMVPPLKGETAPKEPKVKGESSDKDESIKGEGSDRDSDEPSSNPFDDEKPEDLDSPEAEAEDLILRRSVNQRPIEMSLEPLVPVSVQRRSRPDHSATNRDERNLAQPHVSVQTVGAPYVDMPIFNEPTVVLSPVTVTSPGVNLSSITPITVTEIPERRVIERSLPAPRLPLSSYPIRGQFSKLAKPQAVAVQSHASPTRSPFDSEVTAPRCLAVAEVASVNHQTGELLLKGSQLRNLQPGAVGEIYRASVGGGTIRIGHLSVRVIGRSTAQAEVESADVLSRIQIGDQVVCP